MPAQINIHAGTGNKKILFAMVLLGVATVLIGGWQGLRRQSASALPQPLRVGYAVEAPYAYLTADGRVTGQSPEIARQVSERLGLGEPQWVLTEFGSLIDELREGRFDVIAAGMFVTPEREQLVAFSQPTMVVRAGLLVAKGNPAGLHSYQDAIKSSGVRLAVLADSVEARVLANAGMPLTRLIMVPDVTSGVSLLKFSRVSGLALSEPTVRWLANQPMYVDSFESAEPFQPSEADSVGRVAFAFRRDDKYLRQAWDNRMSVFMQTDDYRELMHSVGLDVGLQTREAIQ